MLTNARKDYSSPLIFIRADPHPHPLFPPEDFEIQGLRKHLQPSESIIDSISTDLLIHSSA